MTLWNGLVAQVGPIADSWAMDKTTLELLAYLLTLLDVQVVIADDFMPTEPAFRVIGDE